MRVDTDVALHEVAAAITDLPSPQHDVIVARDVQRRAPAEVGDELDLTPAEGDLLDQARGRGAQLDDVMREGGT